MRLYLRKSHRSIKDIYWFWTRRFLEFFVVNHDSIIYLSFWIRFAVVSGLKWDTICYHVGLIVPLWNTFPFSVPGCDFHMISQFPCEWVPGQNKTWWLESRHEICSDTTSITWIFKFEKGFVEDGEGKIIGFIVYTNVYNVYEIWYHIHCIHMWFFISILVVMLVWANMNASNIFGTHM